MVRYFFRTETWGGMVGLKLPEIKGVDSLGGKGLSVLTQANVLLFMDVA